MTDTHGNEPGYQRHIRASEQPCGHCIWGHNLYQRELRNKKRKLRDARPFVKAPIQHGTPQGLAWHSNQPTPVCEVCLTAACDWERFEANRYLRRLRAAS